MNMSNEKFETCGICGKPFDMDAQDEGQLIGAAVISPVLTAWYTDDWCAGDYRVDIDELDAHEGPVYHTSCLKQKLKEP